MSYSKEIDRKWQKNWDESNLAAFDEKRMANKLYVLEMFSYPSAAKLHVGHWYNYALWDSYARMKKMQGCEIFQPMGFDAFGLPAENYAIATGIHPQDSTNDSINSMRRQLKEIGGLFNWDADLDGRHVEVTLQHFIRPEMKFNGLEALKQQISLDAELAKQFFKI